MLFRHEQGRHSSSHDPFEVPFHYPSVPCHSDPIVADTACCVSRLSHPIAIPISSGSCKKEVDIERVQVYDYTSDWDSSQKLTFTPHSADLLQGVQKRYQFRASRLSFGSVSFSAYKKVYNLFSSEACLLFTYDMSIGRQRGSMRSELLKTDHFRTEGYQKQTILSIRS